VQRVLVSHGEPLLRGGKKALERVLAWHECYGLADELPVRL